MDYRGFFFNLLYMNLNMIGRIAYYAIRYNASKDTNPVYWQHQEMLDFSGPISEDMDQNLITLIRTHTYFLKGILINISTYVA